VLFADEAQNLHELHYEWLRDLHDELENNALRLFVFLVGQPQLMEWTPPPETASMCQSGSVKATT